LHCSFSFFFIRFIKPLSAWVWQQQPSNEHYHPLLAHSQGCDFPPQTKRFLSQHTSTVSQYGGSIVAMMALAKARTNAISILLAAT
jgi:hypothetical protein